MNILSTLQQFVSSFTPSLIGRAGVGLLLLTAAFTSCDDDIYDFDGVVLGVESKGQLRKAQSTLLEVPAFQANDIFITHDIVLGTDTVMNYCLAYDTTMYHSRWVAFRFDESNRAKTVGRSNSFQDDPSLPARFMIGNNTFNGYDRGHLCASNDRLISAEANEQTFYMTNMSPQLGQFNQQYWVNYETFVANLGRDKDFADTLYVVKGGTIREDQIRGWATRPNGKKVAIPEYYYMALLKVKAGGYQSMAFLMEHREYTEDSNSKEEKKAHVVSIDSLEHFTGIDFFHNLPDTVENTVEKSFSFADWNLQ